MRLLINNHLANAYDSLRANRLRTGLTVLGVTIGIGSIIVILSLSAGAAKIITDQVDSLGGTIAVIRPGTPERDSKLSDLTAALASKQATSSLTEKDMEDIRQIDHITTVAPIMLLGGSVTADNNKPRTVELLATTPELVDVATLPLHEGQFIDSVTNQDTAVVGSQLSVDLFGTQESIGHTFHTHGVRFTVIGVLKHLDRPINYNNVDFDHAAIISLQSGKDFNQGIAAIQQINVRATSPDKLPRVLQQIDDKLRVNHHGEKDYVILDGDTLAQPTSELFTAVAATLAVVAGVSLVVGGIGIMNIMLVGVSERTREIGIRKALGASNTHIVWQFLIESLAMSLAGGAAGYIFGYVTAFAISRTFLPFDPAFNWQIVGIAFGISLSVGLLFGIYPAIRAARRNPIEALRQYH